MLLGALASPARRPFVLLFGAIVALGLVVFVLRRDRHRSTQADSTSSATATETGSPAEAPPPPVESTDPVESSDPMLNRVIGHDLVTSDPAPVADFYADVLGWSSRIDQSDFSYWYQGSEPIAGAQRIGGLPYPYWRPTVLVRDVDETVRVAMSLKGDIVYPAVDIPNGRFATLADPKGVVFGVYQSSAPVHVGNGTAPGEFAWNEYTASDRASAEFYKTLFGWTQLLETDLAPTKKYLYLGLEGPAGPAEPIGGMLIDPGLPRGGWVSYVKVADLDAALQRVKAARGAILVPPTLAPNARIAVVRDPTGGVFGLHETAKSK